jgi:hypothetical protein
MKDISMKDVERFSFTFMNDHIKRDALIAEYTIAGQHRNLMKHGYKM